MAGAPPDALSDTTRALLATLQRRSSGPPVTVVHRPARVGAAAGWPDWVDARLRQRLAEGGVSALWTHQRLAADLARAGQDVVVATGTASGKSVAYQLPALQAVLDGGRPAPTVLYLAPTKALAADQAAGLLRLALPQVRLAVVDGDTDDETRAWARRQADVILSNPDWVHHALLPGHHRWASFLRGLRYVVVDECHHYRGIFGAHVGQVLRRLWRVSAGYGATPTVVLASASTADPAATARTLTGRDTVAVGHDGSPAGAVDVVLVGPEGRLDPGTAPAAVDLLCTAVRAGHSTLAFVRSRRAAESVATQARAGLAGDGLASRVAAYRGGYLPEERRELESALRTRRLLGVATTNALELGIDVAAMEVVLLVGWPGSRASFWQQVGRAGRDTRHATAVFLARDDPLDAYVVRHPEVVLDEPVERSVLDVTNPRVLDPHVCAAAAERPWTEAEVAADAAPLRPALDRLTEARRLRRRAEGWFWAGSGRPSAEIDLRGGGAQTLLIESGTGRLLGTVDQASTPAMVHPGAVYVHQGAVFEVQDLDLDEGVAVLRAGDPGWVTVPRTVTDLHVVADTEQHRYGPVTVAVGEVCVTRQVVAYQRRRSSGDLLGELPLDLPAQPLSTVGMRWSIDPAALTAVDLPPRRWPGAVHAAEHAAIGLLPVFATCDRWDLGGVSSAHQPDTGEPTVVVHDAYAGGAGFAERGYAVRQRWLAATADAIRQCPCVDGCPSCVQSPKCGSGNDPLDKTGAVTVLDLVLARLPDD